jgi:hypothetical protein
MCLSGRLQASGLLFPRIASSPYTIFGSLDAGSYWKPGKGEDSARHRRDDRHVASGWKGALVAIASRQWAVAGWAGSSK